MAPVLVSGIKPVWSDHDQDHVSGGDLLVQIVDEIDPGRDVVDVHEHALAADRLREPVVHAAGARDAVVTPIIDEDATGHPRPWKSPENDEM